MNAANRRLRASLCVTSLEDRTTPAGWMATAADAGGGPHVIIRTDPDGDGKFDQIASSFFAFDASFRGGVRIAVGNVNRDSYNELITAAGPGDAPLVRIWTIDDAGRVLGLQEQFYAFDPNFRGGVYLTAGDYARETIGTPVAIGPGNVSIPVQDTTLVISAGPGGGPHVKVFRDTNSNGYVSDNLVDEFYAFDAKFRGGVRLATGHFYAGTPALPGDIVVQYISDFDYLICAAGPGGGPHVKIYNSFGEFDANEKISDNGIVDEFFAFDPSYRGGVSVGTSNLAAVYYGLDDLIVGGDGQVNVYRLAISQTSTTVLPGTHRGGVPTRFAHTLLNSYQPLSGYTGEVHVGGFNSQLHPGSDLVTSFGTGADAKMIIWSGASGDGNVDALPKIDEFTAFAGPGGPFNVGVWVVQGF